MPSVTDVRRQFLDFFASKNHTILPSSSLVPHNDPTLMFTAAGMVPFKNYFNGSEKPPTLRATTSQKCVRAGGKHNDLDNVGYTSRHHTFFEMLGNFSFGDYFKQDAIAYAWELVTKIYGIPAEKLGVTVYHTDDEAFALWKKIAGLPDHKILRVPTSDNFWAAGDTGPCGPCTEIFYDHGKGDGSWALDATGHDMFGERYVEIWNLVFMQFDAQADGSRINLPKPSIDTGSGLERVAAVLQGVNDNYAIDLFKNLIAASIEYSHNNDPDKAVSHRVIADHLRSTSFLIADGVLPSNEGRGYVLRRIMRRAMRHAHLLGCAQPLMHKLVPTLVLEMGAAYPELKHAEAAIIDTLRLEEERFKDTLTRGLKLLEEEKTKLAHGAALPGDVAFKLYDTYGFPLDLTQDILRAENIGVDMDGFTTAMTEQKTRARAAWKGSGAAATSAIWFDIKERVGASEFLGYAMDEAQGIVVALLRDGQEVAALAAGESGQLITNQTPFYAESGGQIGDTGSITSSAAQAHVTDTSKALDGLHVHAITVTHGAIKNGDTVTLRIDSARRDRIRANHSATHLLHAVLRQQLGAHITQKGSLVAEDKLRFDVTHPKAITREELDAVEHEVNRLIWNNSDVTTKLMTPDEAVAAGAMALFGEKYGDEVRVLSMGTGNYSVELCGGTHVHRVGDIGLFKITSEGAVAAGIRRIEAVTQAGAFAYLNGQDSTVRELAGSLKIKPEELREKVAALAEEKKKLERQLADMKKQLAMGGSAGGEDATAEMIGSTLFLGKNFGELDAKSLRDLANSLQQKHPTAVIAALSTSEGKANIIVAIGKDIAGRVQAPELVKVAVATVGGTGGGGRPDFAQGGGPNGNALDAALAAMKTALAQ